MNFPVLRFVVLSWPPQLPILLRNSLLETGAWSLSDSNRICWTKWLSVCLQTSWGWFWILLLSPKLEIWCLFQARSSLTFRPLWFTLKLVCNMIITCSQMHRTDKYSKHSSIIWKVIRPVWINYWVFVYKLKWFWVQILLLSPCYCWSFRPFG